MISLSTDVDECFQAYLNEESICHGNQICQNIPGNFSCACPSGSQLQGTICIEIDLGMYVIKCFDMSLYFMYDVTLSLQYFCSYSNTIINVIKF